MPLNVQYVYCTESKYKLLFEIVVPSKIICPLFKYIALPLDDEVLSVNVQLVIVFLLFVVDAPLVSK